MQKVIVDVREPEEFAAGHVSGAVNLPLGQIMGGKFDVAKDSEIIVYCNRGNRSGVAQQFLSHKGYKHVKNGINQQNVEASYS